MSLLSLPPVARYPTLHLNDTFPDLEGETQNDANFQLYEYLGNNWGLIFMHPGDFTPVCTTELGQAALREAEFAQRGVKLCGFSCNDAASHRAWIQDIAAATGGQVNFPLLADPDRKMACDLGFLDHTNIEPKSGLPLTVRGVYILKPDKTIALSMTYPASTGRNFDEIFRVIDSVIRAENKAVATPVDWRPGDDVIVNFPLSNQQADETFGKGNWKAVPLPSEKGKTLKKNYLRMTKDPGPVLESKTSDRSTSKTGPRKQSRPSSSNAKCVIQ